MTSGSDFGFEVWIARTSAHPAHDLVGIVDIDQDIDLIAAHPCLPISNEVICEVLSASNPMSAMDRSRTSGLLGFVERI
jgi:hypothetical protein